MASAIATNLAAHRQATHAAPRATNDPAWVRWTLVVASLALQFGWLVICWAIIGRDWTPP